MMEANHTPEPWPQPTYENDTGPDDGGFWEWWQVGCVAKFDDGHDAERAVACVNACAGINPAAVPKLVEALELIQGFNWRLDESDHGKEIKRRALRALALAKPQHTEA